ncbi:MAG TPA: D-TA family PLP-dependent enzyme [Verrucomicrobiae bacterium]|nr:D-TA family PLP-dependent enzyme [Verrucomicrobiae bacterium]
MQRGWHLVENVDEVSSPALLIYPERVRENVRRMISTVKGDVARLRPHIKTHKLPELIALQMEQGITRFKCATIAEAEMLAGVGAPDVLLGYQPVGPNVGRLVELIRKFPKTSFSTVADNAQSICEISAAMKSAGLEAGAGPGDRARSVLDLFLDIDCGMRRTGVAPGPQAVELYRRIANSIGIKAAGLHAYDGHIHERDPAERVSKCEAAFGPVLELRVELERQGLAVPRIVAGGTPTFPFHAARGRDIDCSPGTCVLWDFGYSSQFADLDFLHAAVLLTRVVSKPAANRLCLDLGHKAVASENPHPRVHLLEIPNAKFVMHSEEHLVIETDQAERFQIGAPIYGVPWHICPTVALHSEAVAVMDGKAKERWSIAARARRLTI